MLHQIDRWDDLPGAIAIAETVGAIGLAELLRALRDGRIALLSLHPDTLYATFRHWSRATARSPAVLLIGDDDGFNRGPDGWPLVQFALKWAASLVIHAAAAERWHYQGAITTAQIHRRVVLIESCDRTMGAWLARAAAMEVPRPTLLITPIDSRHPIVPNQRDTQ